MTKPRKDTDYLFLSARIRSLEKDLLTSQRLEQLLQSPSVENCSQLLSDLGYAPIRDEASLQSSLKRQREAVFAELERFMPEKQLLDVFRIKYDYHNIKVLLKAPEGAERLLMDAGTIPVSELQRKYADSGNWQFLPRDMAGRRKGRRSAGGDRQRPAQRLSAGPRLLPEAAAAGEGKPLRLPPDLCPRHDRRRQRPGRQAERGL